MHTGAWSELLEMHGRDVVSIIGQACPAEAQGNCRLHLTMMLPEACSHDIQDKMGQSWMHRDAGEMVGED